MSDDKKLYNEIVRAAQIALVDSGTFDERKAANELEALIINARRWQDVLRQRANDREARLRTTWEKRNVPPHDRGR